MRDDQAPGTDAERIAQIRKRAENEEYHSREHWGTFDADADVLFLLARVTALEAERDEAKTAFEYWWGKAREVDKRCHALERQIAAWQQAAQA